jgi:hypothetical protein
MADSLANSLVYHGDLAKFIARPLSALTEPIHVKLSLTIRSTADEVTIHYKEQAN